MKRMIFGLIPTRVTRLNIVWCMLLLLVLTPSLAFVACAGPMATPTPSLTPPSAPAVFQIVGLAVSPTEVSPGQEVTIIAKVINTGDADGIYPAKLEVNNIAEVLKNVTVPAGGTQTLSFLLSKDIPGTYEVTFGEAVGQFIVAEPVELTQPSNPQITPARSCCGSQSNTSTRRNVSGCCGCGGCRR